MPHNIVEYSRTLEDKVSPETIIEKIFHGAVQSELFDENDIKTRARAYDHHHKGGGNIDFIHVMMRILSGRTDKQKKMLSHKVLDQLRTLDLSGISLTIEIVDIHRDVYAKQVVPVG